MQFGDGGAAPVPEAVMIRLQMSFGLAVFLAGGAVFADDQADARALIDKAVKAIGGEAAIAKRPAAVWKAKVLFAHPPGDGKMNCVGTWSVALPARCHISLVFESDDQPFSFVFIKDGERMWTTNLTGDDVKEESGQDWTDSMYGSWVAGLTPLRDKAFTLSILRDEKVSDRPAAGVKVTREGKPAVHLFFDRETGLLVKTVFLREEEVWMECVYSGYKDFDGFKHPTKAVLTERGKPFMEQEIIEYKRVEKLDEKLFGRP